MEREEEVGTSEGFLKEYEGKFLRRRKFSEARIEREIEKSQTRFTYKDVEYALRKCKGNLTQAAILLGTKRPALKRLIDNNPHLLRVLQDIREQVLDLAESQLFEQAESGYFPAISMVLKTLGKERGYTERATVEHDVSPNLPRNSAALIEAMKKGTIELEESEWAVENHD